MMKQLKYFFNIAVAVALTACSNEDAPQVPPTEKEPLLVTASVDGSLPTATTRASGDDFAIGDEIVARLQHVYGETPTVVEGSEFTKQVTFTAGTETAGSYLLTASTGLFWDDFSNSSSTDKDIRTDGHGVRSYYAYCLNGGTATNLSESDGTLTWTVKEDQSEGDNLKQSDLLWSGTQLKATYKHESGGRGKITLPFTHAMSKVTIVVKAEDGFSTGALSSTKVTLKNMYKSATVNLPGQSLTAQAGTGDVIMCPTTSESGLQRTYEAIIVPGMKFTKDHVLAEISNADGNDYKVYVTDAMLENNAWGAQYDNVNGTKSGVNYSLTVIIKKQKIEVVAKLADWTDVTSTGAQGEIQFTGDITDASVTNPITTDGSSFDLYYMKEGGSSFSESTNWSYSSSTSSWTNTTPIYWPNGMDAFYFRALAKYVSDTQIESSATTTVNQGNDDILWATTPAHTWNGSTIAEGDPVHPRTGAVPLSFRHALSKVTVKLKTSDDDDNKKVNLTGATVTITPIATTGTLKLDDGKIELPTGEANGQFTGTVNDDKSISSLTIPQSISNNVKLQVKLSDGTTYSLQLNTCKNSSDVPIIQWGRGNHYTYEVTLNKEKISFVAFLKEWVNETGSGDATLDW